MNSFLRFFLLSIFVFFLFAVGLYWGTRSQSQLDGEEGLLLYCAAGIKPPVIDTVKDYEEEYGVKVRLQYGGSGQLLSNLRVSNSGDLYLAGDASYIERAQQEGLVQEMIPLATMVPVIAVKKGNPKEIEGISDLLREEVQVAIANPEAAAVGRMTQKILEKSGEWRLLQEKAKVQKPTVNDIANDIKIGSVDAGIVWDSIGAQYEALEVIHTEAMDQGVQEVAIGVLSRCERPAQALHFARYLGARDQGLQHFKKHGYNPVDGDVWAEVPQVVLFSGGVNRVAIEDTIQEFEEREGVEVTRVYNGCGILVSQMKGGKRPDAYFACDLSFITQVGDLFHDALNVSETDMLILVEQDNPKNIQSLEDLAQPGFKVGVANAEQSALGALTKNLLQEMGIYEEVMKNVKVQTPTADLLVNQIQTGSLDAVIVYEANTVKVRDKMELIRIDHPKALAVQPYAVAKSTENKYLMQRLKQAISSEQSKDHFQNVGFRWRADEIVKATSP